MKTTSTLEPHYFSCGSMSDKKWMDTIHEMQKAQDKKLNQLEKDILTLPTIQEGEYVGVCKDDIKLEFAKFRR